MKLFHWAALCSCSFAISLLAGCAETTDDSLVQRETGSAPQSDSAIEAPGETVTAQKVGEETGNAFDQVGDLAAQGKERFTSSIKEQVAGFDEKLAELDRRAATLGEDAKSQWEPIREELQQRRDQVDQQVQKLETAGADQFAQLREGATTAWQQLQESLQKATQFIQQHTGTQAGTAGAADPAADAAQAPSDTTPPSSEGAQSPSSEGAQPPSGDAPAPE